MGLEIAVGELGVLVEIGQGGAQLLDPGADLVDGQGGVMSSFSRLPARKRVEISPWDELHRQGELAPVIMQVVDADDAWVRQVYGALGLCNEGRAGGGIQTFGEFKSDLLAEQNVLSEVDTARAAAPEFASFASARGEQFETAKK